MAASNPGHLDPQGAEATPILPPSIKILKINSIDITTMGNNIQIPPPIVRVDGKVSNFNNPAVTGDISDASGTVVNCLAPSNSANWTMNYPNNALKVSISVFAQIQGTAINTAVTINRPPPQHSA
jgi:hypothetical protein